MKLRILTFLTVITFLAALALPTQCLAQENNQKLPHYTVIDLGTLGGTYSAPGGVSNGGWVTGYATLTNDSAYRWFLWRGGAMKDLGTLGGSDSFSGYRINDWGDAPGQAETSIPDPTGDDWCGANEKCVPALWLNLVKQMIPLPTLGGNNGWAEGINNFDQVVGTAENTTAFPCPGDGEPLFETEPFIWTLGRIQQLPNLPGDLYGQAVAINDLGQAVGYSGNCEGGYTAHAVLWQNGKVIYLGNFGGTNSLAWDINNQGQVTGWANLPGNTSWHAFLWQSHVMKDLGTVAGDVTSGAISINSQAQVVGGSRDASGNESAFLWQNDVMTDLNTLIPSDSPVYLVEADSINDRGQINGYAYQYSTGEVHAFLATPTQFEGAAESATTAPTSESSQRPKIALPENVRKLMQQRGRLGGFKGPLIMHQ